MILLSVLIIIANSVSLIFIAQGKLNFDTKNNKLDRVAVCVLIFSFTALAAFASGANA